VSPVLRGKGDSHATRNELNIHHDIYDLLPIERVTLLRIIIAFLLLYALKAKKLIDAHIAIEIILTLSVIIVNT